jgi:hypothetical protein
MCLVLATQQVWISIDVLGDGYATLGFVDVVCKRTRT